MKHLILTLSLTLGLMMAGPSLAAQEDSVKGPSDEKSVSEPENRLQIGSDGIKFDVNFDDEDSDEMKLDKVAKLIGTVLNEDVGDGLSVEFKTLDEEEKEKLVEAIESGFSFDKERSRSIPGGAILLALPAIVLFFGTPVFLLMVLLFKARPFDWIAQSSIEFVSDTRNRSRPNA